MFLDFRASEVLYSETQCVGRLSVALAWENRPVLQDLYVISGDPELLPFGGLDNSGSVDIVARGDTIIEVRGRMPLYRIQLRPRQLLWTVIVEAEVLGEYPEVAGAEPYWSEVFRLIMAFNLLLDLEDYPRPNTEPQTLWQALLED